MANNSSNFLYIDTNSEGTVDILAQDGKDVDHSTDLAFGYTPVTGGHEWYQGGIDEVSIFTKVLSSAEVTELYGGRTPETAGDATGISGLGGYWKFEGGSGITAVDSSNNNNSGTLTNMEARDWVEH